MADIFEVKSVCSKTTLQNEYDDGLEVKFLTLGYQNRNSDVQYHISISGPDADIAWDVGDKLMLELRCLAYKHNNQWHISHQADSIQLIECSTDKTLEK